MMLYIDKNNLLIAICSELAYVCNYMIANIENGYDVASWAHIWNKRLPRTVAYIWNAWTIIGIYQQNTLHP